MKTFGELFELSPHKMGKYVAKASHRMAGAAEKCGAGDDGACKTAVKREVGIGLAANKLMRMPAPKRKGDNGG